MVGSVTPNLGLDLALQGSGPGLRQDIIKNFEKIDAGVVLAKTVISTSSPPTDPVVEIGQTTGALSLGNGSNVPIRIAKTINPGTLIQPSLQLPAKDYDSNRDASGAYISLVMNDGFNGSISTNADRTQAVAYQARVIHRGQGDLAAFSFLSVGNSFKPGATHWLASPAVIGINGTAAAQAHGVYLNPREIYLHDTPSNPKRSVAVGDVIRMDRNIATQPKGAGGIVENGGIGEVWAAYRVQSVGTVACDNILSATGKWLAGVDLTMPSLDFGTNKAAISIKQNDRIYLNGSAQQIDDSNIFIRSDWRHTSGFGDYISYQTELGTPRIAVFVGGTESLNVTSASVNANTQFNANNGVYVKTGFKYFVAGQGVVGGRIGGWGVPTGTLTRTTFNTETATTTDVARRLAALIADLHISSSGHGLIGA